MDGAKIQEQDAKQGRRVLPVPGVLIGALAIAGFLP